MLINHYSILVSLCFSSRSELLLLRSLYQSSFTRSARYRLCLVSSLDRSPDNIDLLASWVLWLGLADSEVQRHVVITDIVVLANVPVVQCGLCGRLRRDNSIVVAIWNEHLVVLVETNLLSVVWRNRSELSVSDVGRWAEDEVHGFRLCR